MFERIHEYFEQEVDKHPNTVAIVDGIHHSTYRGLNQLSNQFARYLLSKGVICGDLVPILADKSINSLIAVLGVLKAGAIYVPINRDLPIGSIAAIFLELKASIVCVDDCVASKLECFSLTQVRLGNLPEKISSFDHHNLTRVGSEKAYVIYTSGTTGKPKGVEITHANLSMTYSSWKEIYALCNTDVHLQMANFSFDVFAGDWIRALSSGGTLVLCPQPILLDPERLFNFIQKESITVAEFVPQVLRRLLDYCKITGENLSQFRLLIAGSDSWTMKEYRLARFLGGTKTRVISSYGSTETTIDSSYYEEEKSDHLSDYSIVPIGKPFPHVHFLVLNENQQEVTTGERGELYVGGVSVGAGYFGQPTLSSERFKTFPQGRFYKTGDLVRIGQDGNFDFIGRDKSLVKIDGKRVELPSIESVLLEHPNISFAMASSETQGEKIVLNAFFKSNNPDLTYENLILFLKDKLPDYSIPKRFYVIHQLKYNNNGKVDRTAIEKLTQLPLKPLLSAPGNRREAVLLQLWKDILNHEEIGIHNNFSECGGDSLLYVTMLAQVSKRFGVTLLPSEELFTIRSISDRINAILTINKSEDMMKPVKLFVIGGGPAAVSICLQVVEEYKRHQLIQPLEIMVFEKGHIIGPGLPYSKSDDCYILNLPKDMMEPVYGTMGSFTAWLKSKPEAPQDTAFPPRHYFGKYLQFLAEKMQVTSGDVGITIQYHTNCEVLDVEDQGDEIRIMTSQGDKVGDYLVFCTGHMPSSNYKHFIGKKGYFHNPWEEKLYERLNPDSDLIIVGTRLTAIDVVRKLFTSGHRGKVTMVSRSGVLPTVLSKEIPPYTLKHLTLANFDRLTQSGLSSLSLEDLAKLSFAEVNEAEGKAVLPHNIVRSYKEVSPEVWLAQQIKWAEAGAKPWQQVLFAAYPIVPNIWAMLSIKDKKTFIRHYKSSFLTYLAAFPLDNAYKLQEHLASGQLNCLGGITDIVEDDEKGFVVNFEDRPPLASKILINATGPGYEPSMDPLYSRLIKNRLLEIHEAGGVNVDPKTLQVFSPRIGGQHPRMFGVGEITWGACLATTDMSRVAIQSGRVALSLTRDCLKSRELSKQTASCAANKQGREKASHLERFSALQWGTFFRRSVNRLRTQPMAAAVTAAASIMGVIAVKKSSANHRGI
jgi:amino acid adenylation domain-containing protein